MKGVLGVFLALAIFSPLAEARLGETREQCIVRYGEPIFIDVEHGAATFHKAGFLIKVFFHENRCEWLTLAKFADGSTEAFQEIGDFEIESMMAANSEDQDWEKLANQTVPGFVWRTSDDSLRASYDPAPHSTLSIYTTAAFRRRSFTRR
jgi:hypothetical protein